MNVPSHNPSLNDPFDPECEPARQFPVAIGGMGGSGTRLIADMLIALGFHLGDDLNGSTDNLWFTLLFKHPALLDASDQEIRRRLVLFVNAMRWRRSWNLAQRERFDELVVRDHPQHDAEWLWQRMVRLRDSVAHPAPQGPLWGWKEPNTQWLLDRLSEQMPGMRYIHVMRNGLDMACSANQNQYRLWSARLYDDLPRTPGPRQALKFWCRAQQRFMAQASGMGERVLRIDFDALCDDPEQGLDALVQFTGTTIRAEQRRALAGRVRPLASRGRFRALKPADFDAEDIDYVRSLGFDTAFD